MIARPVYDNDDLERGLARLTVADVLRVAGVGEPNAKGYFPCPAHADDWVSPNAHVLRSGRGWRCFRCNAKGGLLDLAIALGLAHDRAEAARVLVPDLADPPARPAKRRAPTKRDIEAAIRVELGRKHEAVWAEVQERVGVPDDGPIPQRPFRPLRSSEVNEVRVRAFGRVGLPAGYRPALPGFDWEESPHDEDPLWRTLYERAIEEVVAERWARSQARAADRAPEYREWIMRASISDPAGPTRTDRLRAVARARRWLRDASGECCPSPQSCNVCGYSHRAGTPHPFAVERQRSRAAMARCKDAMEMVELFGPFTGEAA